MCFCLWRKEGRIMLLKMYEQESQSTLYSNHWCGINYHSIPTVYVHLSEIKLTKNFRERETHDTVLRKLMWILPAGHLSVFFFFYWKRVSVFPESSCLNGVLLNSSLLPSLYPDLSSENFWNVHSFQLTKGDFVYLLFMPTP